MREPCVAELLDTRGLTTWHARASLLGAAALIVKIRAQVPFIATTYFMDWTWAEFFSVLGMSAALPHKCPPLLTRHTCVHGRVQRLPTT